MSTASENVFDDHIMVVKEICSGTSEALKMYIKYRETCFTKGLAPLRRVLINSL